MTVIRNDKNASRTDNSGFSARFVAFPHDGAQELFGTAIDKTLPLSTTRRTAHDSIAKCRRHGGERCCFGQVHCAADLRCLLRQQVKFASLRCLQGVTCRNDNQVAQTTATKCLIKHTQCGMPTHQLKHAHSSKSLKSMKLPLLTTANVHLASRK